MTYINYSELNNSNITKNLFALKEFNEPLVEMLKTEEMHNKLRLFFDDLDFLNAEYLINRKFVPFYCNPPNLEIPDIYEPWLKIQKTTLLFGAELGYGLKYLLNKSRIPRIYLYERDKCILKVALTLHDFASEIVEQRLVIVPQEEILTLVNKDIEGILPAPILFRENKVEYLTLSRMIKTRRLAKKRAVIFSGTLFILDCAATLFDQGWDVFEIDPDIMKPQIAQHLLDRLNPEIIIKINLHNQMEQYCRQRVVVEWEIDPIAFPIPAIKPHESEKLFVFTHNPDRVLKYQKSGYSHIEYLPLCANANKFYSQKLDPESKNRFGCDVSFVGSLMFKSQQSFISKLLDILSRMSSVENERWDKIHTWITNLISKPPVMSKKLNLIEDLKNLLNTLKPIAQLQEEKFHFLLISSVEEYLAYLWRKQVVTAMVPLRIHIWGTEEWQHDFTQNYRGKADHYLDLPKLYQNSKINLDIARLYQPNVVTMRVFDVLACGGFVLADRNAALLDLFQEGQEIVCYDTPEEAIDKSKYYLKHESERLAIARRGRQKVVRSHTFEKRINYILKKTGLG